MRSHEITRDHTRSHEITRVGLWDVDSQEEGCVVTFAPHVASVPGLAVLAEVPDALLSASQERADTRSWVKLL